MDTVRQNLKTEVQKIRHLNMMEKQLYFKISAIQHRMTYYMMEFGPKGVKNQGVADYIMVRFVCPKVWFSCSAIYGYKHS